MKSTSKKIMNNEQTRHKVLKKCDADNAFPYTENMRRAGSTYSFMLRVNHRKTSMSIRSVP